MRIVLYRIVFLLLISSVFATDLWGQRPFFKKIPLPRELSQYSVNCMYQDAAGFIWLGTTRGLYKYTGNQFQHYQAPLELTDLEVTSLYQDRQLRFWIGFQNGTLAQLHNNQMQVLDTTAGPASPITAFAQDKNDRLWISTYGNGLYTYEGQKIRQVTEISGLADKDIYDIVIDSLQRIYLGTDNGIMVLPTDDLTQLQQITIDQGLPDNIVVSFTMNNEGNIWAGTYNRGVSLIQSAPLEVKDTRLDWNHGVLMDLQWAADQLWMATENQGILQFDPLTEALNAHTLDNDQPISITNMLLDKDHNLWLAHESDQLSWVQPGLFFLSADQHEAFQNITAIGYQDNANIWFANDRGLHNYKVATGVCKPYLQKQWANLAPVNTLVVDSDQNIWLGTWKGIYRFSVSTNELRLFAQPQGLINDNILSLALSKDYLWIATLGGVSRLSLGSNEFVNFQDASLMGARYVYQVYVDDQQRAWFGTDGNGLIMWDGQGFHSYAESQPDSSLVVYSITEDHEGTIWFTSPNQGLFSFDGQTFSAYGVEVGLRDLEIDAMACDSKGNLLLVHDAGFDLLNPQSRDIMYFGEESGINAIEVGLNNITVDDLGNLWVGSSEGIVRFHQWHEPSEMKPKTIIDRTSIFLEPLPLKNDVILKYNQNHISFEYASNWYQNLNEITYQTKLEGHDLDWNTVKGQSVTYPKLSPGKYVFKVRSSINDRFNSATVADFSFTIAHPWWQKAWFLISSGILVALGLVGYIRQREKKLRSEEQLKKDLIQTQLETLKSQVNPHFLFNSFNTLAGIIEDNPSAAVSYVERLSDFFRSTLTFRDQQLIPLRQELNLVDHYTFLQKQRYGNNFEISMQVPEDYLDLLIPPLTLQILVENAFKHNIVSRQKPLQVKVHGEKHYLFVCNNKQLKAQKMNSTGFGLFSITNRYKLLSPLPIEIKDDSADFFKVGVPLLNENEL